MSLELRVERDGELVRLLSPEVGLFTCALARGAALAPGQRAGVLDHGHKLTLSPDKEDLEEST